MGSLSDPSDVGARAISGASYAVNMSGPGRWVRLPDLGLLWTNDSDSVQLNWVPNADQDAANAIRVGLKSLARSSVPAAVAFDQIASRYSGIVRSGDLSSL
ncbi:hypothetical protein CH305_18440 [Rhodococcus sp. 15-649-2-2]|uniref:hypothetical protein n=1 Tax=Rhodococcus sp. 15-649-2-2 TaxID=2023140 RepID=UPI000B9A448B|nr:hypothetical protein [Rhodococcus sp. 15-649-2-2]OZE77216.1 hypothetical protein CH305_18440 [Rhodococcus sp. 15-649-2-2]